VVSLGSIVKRDRRPALQPLALITISVCEEFDADGENIVLLTLDTYDLRDKRDVKRLETDLRKALLAGGEIEEGDMLSPEDLIENSDDEGEDFMTIGT